MASFLGAFPHLFLLALHPWRKDIRDLEDSTALTHTRMNEWLPQEHILLLNLCPLFCAVLQN